MIAALAAVYLALLPSLFAAGSGWPDAARIGAGLAVLAPLAFAMGVPFPTGLQVVSARRPELVPWAWGVNGAASVVAPPLATVAAVHAGFTVVVAAAVGLYAFAWWAVIGGRGGWSREG